MPLYTLDIGLHYNIIKKTDVKNLKNPYIKSNSIERDLCVAESNLSKKEENSIILLF